jgi:putative dimethyl sulfoxide reductase chaperone
LVREDKVTAAAEQAAIAEQRGATYWLLARLVLEVPTVALLDEIGTALGARPDDASLPLAAEVAALAEAVAQASLGQPAVIDLQAEHTRLWSGLSKRYGPPPPYESVLLEERLPGDATTAVAAAYAEAGLSPEVPDTGPADHLGNELRFLALCCASEANAWRSGEILAAREWLGREAVFLSDHVLRWVPVHGRRVSGEARTAYHRAVAALIATACELDAKDVDELRADLTPKGPTH